MCGIAGLWLPNGDPAALTRRARAMADALAHRGPDGAGLWHDPAAGLALAQRRLAIIDISPGGAQPMADRSGRWIVTFNGELYGYPALRDELAGLGFPVRGASDTAVLLEAIACWGVEAALPRLNGMFAFAAWDRRARRLWLARDHAGIKPLFYRATPGALLFGSETKALLAAGLFAQELDTAVAAQFLRDACVAAPASAIAGVRQLRPGELLAFDAPDQPRAVRWFDPATLGAEPFRGSEAEAAEQLDALLTDAVRLQQVADVPVGAFLSGGIDSTTVAARMANARTFTIGFADADYAEQAHAEGVARHLGTQHTTLVAEAADMQALLPAWLAAMDEPFADSSVLPTLMLSRLARAHATVALSGDGGDELFGGYRRHVFAARHWPRLSRWPRGARALAGSAIRTVPEAWLNRLPLGLTRPGEALHKLASVLGVADAADAHARLAAAWPEAAARPAPPVRPEGGDALLASRRADYGRYLPDDVLTKVDRAAMMVALEVRVPLLDPRIVRFAFGLPGGFLVDRDGGKRILRRLLARRLPHALIDRPKMGFSIPLDAWLRGPWRDWVEALLEERRLREAGLYDVATVRAAWAEHQSGRAARHHALWCVLMLEAWRERTFSARAASAAAAPNPGWRPDCSGAAGAPPPAPGRAGRARSANA
jgi:asparagine synthase (glutamine-hydrolysing)